MRDLIVQLAPGRGGDSQESKNALLDQEVEEFSRYMSALDDWKSAGPLHPQEKALLKSYLVAKLTGKVL